MRNFIIPNAVFLCMMTLWMSVKTPSSKPEVVTKEKPKKVLYVFFDNCNAGSRNYLMSKVNAFYGFQSEVDTATELPDNAYSSLRGRYKADVLLEYLKDSSYQHVIGITNKDICIPKNKIVDYGIYGLGTCPGPVSITSSYRLKGDALKCLDVILHEVGHNKGLEHCPNKKCLMTAANGGPVKVDKTPWMCQECRTKLR